MLGAFAWTALVTSAGIVQAFAPLIVRFACRARPEPTLLPPVSPPAVDITAP